MSASRPTHRKPYRVTKQREKWSEDEHQLFLEAVDAHGRNWKEIVEHVGTRSVAQVRSHAQKHFLKLEKAGHPEAVPPARPKKPAARPYPVQDRSSGAKGKKRNASCLLEFQPDIESAASPALDMLTTPGQSPRTIRSRRPSFSSGAVDGSLDCGCVTDCEDKGSNVEDCSGCAFSSSCQDNSGISTVDVNYALQGMAGPLDFPPQEFLGVETLGEESPAPDFSTLHYVVGSLFENHYRPATQQRMIQQLDPAQRECLAQMMGHLHDTLQDSCSEVPQQLQCQAAPVQPTYVQHSRVACDGPSVSHNSLPDCLPSFASMQCNGQLEALPLSNTGDEELLDAFKLGPADPLWELPPGDDVHVPSLQDRGPSLQYCIDQQKHLLPAM